jgi:hypothetical protein
MYIAFDTAPEAQGRILAYDATEQLARLYGEIRASREGIWMGHVAFAEATPRLADALMRTGSFDPPAPPKWHFIAGHADLLP